MREQPWTLDEATKIVNALASREDQSFIFTGHARDRMNERGMPENTTVLVCQQGDAVEVRLPEERQPNHRYKMRYRDGNDKLEVVVAVKDRGDGHRIIVITVI